MTVAACNDYSFTDPYRQRLTVFDSSRRTPPVSWSHECDWVAILTPTALHITAQGRRRRTLGRDDPSPLNPSGVPQDPVAFLPANRSSGTGEPRWGVRRRTGTRSQGRAARPWAVLCNAVGVGNVREPRW